MAELLFVEYSNSDSRGRRVIATDFKAVNIYFTIEDMEDKTINALCGLSTQDVSDIKDWLANKGKELYLF